MPYSRVGVMPVLSYNKDVKGSNRSNRSKGITMEDLKKQTALRLAQEQTESPLQQQIQVVGSVSGQQQPQAGQLYPRNNNNNYAYPSDPTVSYPHQVQHHQNYPSQHLQQQQQQQQQQHQHQHQHQHVTNGITNMHLSADNEQHQLPHLPSQEQPQEQRQQHHNQQQPTGYLGASSYDHMNCMPPQKQNVIATGSQIDSQLIGSHHTGNYAHAIDPQMMPRATQPLQPTPAVWIPPNTMQQQQHHQEPPTSYAPDGPHLSTVTRNNSNTSKNKLPHGLTVYELKEMTKARLQSEAAEKSDEVGEIQAISRDRGVSPLDFDSGESLRERAMSRDSSSTGRINSNQVVSYLQNHQVAPKMVQAQLQPPSQMLQSGFHPSSMLGGGGGAAQSSFRTTAARTDTWESTSVASHNSTIYSENLGSESASEVGSFGPSSHRNRSFTYPVVQVVQPLDVASSSTVNNVYMESRSFSNPSPAQASPHRGTGIIGCPSLFNAAVGGSNRRRAVTLSPNTGSILEDRPLRYDTVQSEDRLEIPNFSTVMSASTCLSAAPPMQTLQREYSPVLEQLGLGLDNSYLSNGTESGSVFRNVTTNNGSSLPGISQIGSREHESLHAFPSNTKNKSNFFRESPNSETRVAAPPPGFMTSNTSSNGFTAFSRVGSMDSYCNINRKSHFEPSRSHLYTEDNLASDFGSVLALSGSGRPDRERASTFTFGSNHSNGNNTHVNDGFRF